MLVPQYTFKSQRTVHEKGRLWAVRDRSHLDIFQNCWYRSRWHELVLKVPVEK